MVTRSWAFPALGHYVTGTNDIQGIKEQDLKLNAKPLAKRFHLLSDFKLEHPSADVSQIDTCQFCQPSSV